MAGSQYSSYRTDGQFYYRTVIWNRQPKPYLQVNPYALDDCRITNRLLPANNLTRAPGEDSYLIAVARNKAYESFVSKLGERSEMGVNLVEARRAAEMINHRAFALLTIATKFKRAVRSRQARSIKTYASLWLEYSFGWLPLISDIYNAADVLQRPFPNGRVSARSRVNDKAAWRGPVPSREYYNATRSVRVSVGAHVSVSNPNLWKLNQLGLVNPASVAWELVPWSFVVDWFTSAGAVIASYTDLVGLQLDRAWTTTVSVTDASYMWIEPDGSLYDYFTSHRTQMDRQASIAGPTLLVKPFTGFSLKRGANALALAVQQLRSLH